MHHSEYITGLLANIAAREDLDCEGEFGHVVKEFRLQLPNSPPYQVLLCKDDYCSISKEDQRKRRNDMWKLAQSIYRKACADPESLNGIPL